MEKGELTNTLKIRRRVLYENYKEQIDKMYMD
jgi:long-chain acyl-CoA synthetase